MNRELVFTGFNRPGYLRESIASWNQCDGILDWDAWFLLEPSNVQDQMIAEFRNLEAASINGVVNDHRLGVLRNPYTALKSSFDAGSEFTVLAEDDIVVSSDTLNYFEWAMREYEDDKSVLAVLAFSRNNLHDSPEDRSSVARTKVFCPLVWGTWHDRWRDLVGPNWDLDYTSGNPDGSEAGWDWNMMRVAVREDKDFIYPAWSRSNHIGLYGGTHTSPASFPESQAETFEQFRPSDTYKEIFIRDWKLNDFYPGSN